MKYLSGEKVMTKLGEMMGCRCPSLTSEDEQLRPGAADKETCTALDHNSYFILSCICPDFVLPVAQRHPDYSY